MTFKQGDIVIADFPFTSMTGVKKRPCVVLAQSDSAGDYIVAFISSALSAQLLRSSVDLSPTHAEWGKTGLRVACVIRSDKVMTLNTVLIDGKIGELPSDVLKALKQKLAALLL
jgi:mRNA interferase MazF